jgi:hypothetical protein
MDISTKSFRESAGEKPAVFIYELRAQPDSSLISRIPYLGIRNQGCIALSKKEDIILLNTSYDETYLSWLDSVDFEYGKIKQINFDSNKLLTKAIQELPKNELQKNLPEDYVLIPRMATKDAHEIADYLDKPIFGPQVDLMMKHYDKASFKKICSDLNLPIIPYSYFSKTDLQDENKLRNELSKIISYTDNAIIKQLTASAGAGSLTTNKNSLDDAVKEIINNKIYEEGVLIESMIPLKEEYSSQWVIDFNSKPNLIGISLMHVGPKNAHKGNSYPLSDEIEVLENTHKLVQEMAKQGYIGNTQIDVLRDVNEKMYLSENNTRISGSSFAWEIHDRIKKQNPEQKYFLSSRFRLDKPTSFNNLKKTAPELIYNKKSAGLFPYEIGALPINGTFFGLVTGTDYEHISNQINELFKKGIKSDVLTTKEGYK